MVNRDKIAKEILDGQEKPATQLFANEAAHENGGQRFQRLSR